MASVTRIRTGSLDRRVTFYEMRSRKDGLGGFFSQLYPVATVWASVEPLAGRLVDGESQQRSAEADTRIVVRYRGDITQQHVLAYRGEAFEILQPAEIGRREGLEISARRIAPQPELPDVLRRFPDGEPLHTFAGDLITDFAGSTLRSFDEDPTGGESEPVETFSDAEILTA